MLQKNALIKTARSARLRPTRRVAPSISTMSDKPLALSTSLPAEAIEADGESARAIAQARALVARANLQPAHPPEPFPAELDIASAAGRLREIARAMRTYGVEPGTSEQIEQIAQAILATSALQDPADHRAQRLAEVLHYLEHRIERLLDAHGDTSRSQHEGPGTIPDQQAPAPDNGVTSEPAERTGSPDSLVAPAMQERDTAVTGLAVGVGPAPDRSAPSCESPTDSVASQVEQDLLSLTEFPLKATDPPAAGPGTRDATAEAVARPEPSAQQRPPSSPRAAFAERSDAWHPVPSMWEPPRRASASTAASFSDDPQPSPPSAVDPALANLASSEIAAQVIATAMAQSPRAEPLPRQPADDPLAALKAMSDEERIALFT